MSAFGITFVVFCLSWVSGRVTSDIDHPVADLIYMISTVAFFGALVTGIVLVGMML